MNYFEQLPIELTTEIAEYLQVLDFMNLKIFCEIDTCSLFIKKFKKYYSQNLNENTIYLIYINLLNFYEHYQKSDVKSKINFESYITLCMITKLPGGKKMITHNYRFVEYLILNGYIYPDLDIITIMDNVDLFKLRKIDVKSYFLIIDNNALKILKYVIENDELFSEWKSECLYDDIKISYQSNHIDLEITKLLFENRLYPTDIVSIMSTISIDNVKSFDYLLNKFEMSENHVVYWLTVAMYQDSCYELFIKAFNFYKNMLSNSNCIINIHNIHNINHDIIGMDCKNIILKFLLLFCWIFLLVVA